MISFNYQTDFKLKDLSKIEAWVISSIKNESKNIGEINYIFCSDDALYDMNVKFLNHDTLTDIISFDYTQGILVSGDIYISIDRVLDNSKSYDTSFEEELRRVIIHGVLHYCGYKDKTEEEAFTMRQKEDYYLERYQ
jgi:rRNA maturation RNase YbeY